MLPERKMPRPHQRDGVRRALRVLRNAERVQVTMACGTGKTLLGILVAEGLSPRIVVVLSPTIELLKQLGTSWLSDPAFGLYAPVAVCSDSEVGDWLDTVSGQTRCVTSTIVEDIASVLRAREQVIVFSTYHSAASIGQALTRCGLAAGLVVYDEAHRTAGWEGAFADCLSNEVLPAKKRLFLTATRRVYKFDDAAPGRRIFSMDQCDIYGELAYELSLREAIQRGIILPYKIVVPEIVVDDITELGEAQRANLIQQSLREVVTRFGARKLLTFHRRVRTARAFATTCGKTMPEFKAYWVAGGDSRRSHSLREFAAAERGVVSNAKCLTEGIDVPGIDLVAFCDSKTSWIDVTQAIGRCMRVDPHRPEKSSGYVVVPLIVSRRDSNEATASITNLLNILSAIAQTDPLLQSEINERAAGGSTGQTESEILMFTSSEEGFVSFARDIRLRILNTLVDGWQQCFDALVEFKDKNACLDVPRTYTPVGLSQPIYIWMERQSELFYAGLLEAEKIQKLRRIGFQFKAPEVSDWWSTLDQVKKHVAVMDMPPARGRLRTWVTRQRARASSGDLTAEQVCALQSVLGKLI